MDTDTFDQTYNQLKQVIGDRKLTPETLTLLVMNCMRLAEQTRQNGAAKKALVLRLLQRLVAEVDNEEQRGFLQLALDTVVPSMIDGLITADHGRLLRDAGSAISRLVKKCKCCTSE